jgi:hypothetical protein
MENAVDCDAACAQSADKENPEAVGGKANRPLGKAAVLEIP